MSDGDAVGQERLLPGWRTVSLGDVAVIERASVQPDEIETGTPYVGLENIARGGEFENVAEVQPGELKSTKFSFDQRHVLFGKLRPNLGKVSLPEFAGVCSTDILPILPGDALDRRYLAHYLRQPSMIDLSAARASGANLPRLSPTVLRSFPIPLPPLAEQRRIASILDHADALRAKRRHTLNLLDTLTQSIFLDMFGDPVTNPKHLLTRSLGDVVASIDSGRSPICESKPAPPGELGVLKLGAVSSRGFNPTENKALLAGASMDPRWEVRNSDVLLVRKNTPALVGTTAIVRNCPPGLFLPDLIFRLKPVDNLVVPDYLAQVLRTEGMAHRIKSLASGSAASMVNVSKKRLSQVVIPLPPFSDQERFRHIQLEQVRQVRSLNRSIEECDSLLSSLQHRAFRGEL